MTTVGVEVKAVVALPPTRPDGAGPLQQPGFDPCLVETSGRGQASMAAINSAGIRNTAWLTVKTKGCTT